MKLFCTRFADIFFLLRPVLLIPVWAVLFLAAITGAPLPLFSGIREITPEFWYLFFSFSAVAAAIFVLNQIRDIEGDRENNKLFLLPHGHISLFTAWVVLLVSTGISLLVSALFVGSFAMGCIFFCLLLGYAYNMPPFSLKDRPVGGLVANFLGHGILTYYIGWYGMQYGEFDSVLMGFVYAIPAGFANAAVYAVSTIVDMDGDARAGKTTLAVKYGERSTVWVGFSLVLCSFGTSFLLPHNAVVMIATAGVSVLVFISLLIRYSRQRVFSAFRWPVAFLSICITLYIPFYALLVAGVVLCSRVYYKHRFSLCYPAFGRER
ncbi:UbiA family prenyltransferase [Chitinivibrio alkaliphilus]|uniref:UbiA prenyltransferase n=1 Tax=Chitinivibrio alkaliphilus ACht1 TaxID=1313304 RepID=U7D945_9BACT|nr:UbiA family prenyltransferase [Chitinivibrio alkaliphilus]ERP32106.1 UbiA prenyltransferase [Chitinivibrio alkaliphilus ACht1]